MNTFGLYFQYTSFINFKNGDYLLGAYSFVSHRLFTQFNFKMYDLLSLKAFILIFTTNLWDNMEKIIYMHPFLNLAAFKFIFYQQEYTYPDGKTK